MLLQGDCSSEDDVQSLYTRATSTWGKPVDTLIANHGVFPEIDVPLTDMTLSQWNNTLTINLTGVFLLCKHFMRQLKGTSIDNPSIVIVGSTSAMFGERGHADYSSSKSALHSGFVKTIKNEIVKIAPRGRINVVAPNWTVTPMVEDVLKDKNLGTRERGGKCLGRANSDALFVFSIASAPDTPDAQNGVSN